MILEYLSTDLLCVSHVFAARIFLLFAQLLTLSLGITLALLGVDLPLA